MDINVGLFKSTVYRCSQCNSWYVRLPTFLAELGKGDRCEKCGGTSFSESEGRPFGQESRCWKDLMTQFHREIKHGIPYDNEEINEFFILKESHK